MCYVSCTVFSAQKISFRLRVSLVNVKKSAENCAFVKIYQRKLHIFRAMFAILYLLPRLANAVGGAFSTLSNTYDEVLY